MHLSPSRKGAAAGLVVVGLVILGCSGGVNYGPPSRPLGATEFRMSSAAFLTEYLGNPGGTHAKYSNRVVELTGRVAIITTDQEGRPFFHLEGPDPKKIDTAICQMAEPFPWSRANPGQVVTVKGRGTPSYFVPRLDDCVIADVTGPPLPRLTADEFARRTADPDLLNRKEGYRYLIVGGEVERFDPASSGVHLKTDPNGPGAVVFFSKPEQKRWAVATWTAGKKILVIGGDSTNPSAKVAQLVECLLMEEPK